MKKGQIAIIISFLLLSGCGVNVANLGKDTTQMQKIDKVNTQSGYKKLFKKFQDENKTNDLLWDYEAGSIGYLASDYNGSVYYFNKAENLIKKYDKEVLASKLLANIGAVLTNDTFMAYRPKIYEKIMVNNYKAIDYIDLGDMQDARIEFNRALVRQKKAAWFFRKEIELERKKLEKEKEEKLKTEKLKKQKNNFSIDAIVHNKKTTDVIEKKYTNLFAFKPYRDFVNPFTDYLAGIYFLNVGDYQKANELLKETYGMIKGLDKGSDYVKEDLLLANRMKSSILPRSKHYTWVIFFNGLAPKKKELKIDIPLFLFSNKVYYTGIALPTLVERPRAYKYLYVKTPLQNKKTKEITSMDRIIKLEFKKRFPIIMTRAITRTVIQTIIQKQLHDKAGVIGGILGSMYQAAMNRADTRSWEELPKEFQVVRVKSAKYVRISTPDGKNKVIKTNPNKNTIIFVTIQTRNSEPIISVHEF